MRTVAAARRKGKRGMRSAATDSAAATPGAPSEQVARTVTAINGLIPVRDRRKLQFLSRRTRVPQSEYLREAIRDLLRKYEDAFEGSAFEDELEPL